MNTFETSAIVEDRGQIHVAGVPFEPGTRVEVTITPTRNGTELPSMAESERAARLLAALDKARNKVGEWNTTEASVKDGFVTSKVNGAAIASGKVDLTEGPFGFQSEGAEIHFKEIKIKVLD